MKKLGSLVVLVLAVLALLASCAPAATPTTALPPEEATPTSLPPSADITPTPLAISSTVFEPGAEIPERYGFFRENIPPPLGWTGVPEGTKSLVLLMEDRDVPFSHWVAYNITPDATELPQDGLPEGTLEGLNTNGQAGYAGPYPPPGETHTYAFILYALDTQLDLRPGATQEQVSAAMKGHVLAQAEVLGRYRGVEP